MQNSLPAHSLSPGASGTLCSQREPRGQGSLLVGCLLSLPVASCPPALRLSSSVAVALFGAVTVPTGLEGNAEPLR